MQINIFSTIVNHTSVWRQTTQVCGAQPHKCVAPNHTHMCPKDVCVEFKNRRTDEISKS